MSKKVSVKLIGEDGNVFAIFAKVVRELKRNKLNAEAERYRKEVLAAHSYDEALMITMKYVEIK